LIGTARPIGAIAALAWAMTACAGQGGSSKKPPGDRDGGDAAVVAASAGDDRPATPPGAAPPYLLAALDSDGRVRGAGEIEVGVEWADPAAELLRSGGINACGAPVAPRVSVHTLHGARNTVVTLRELARGKEPNPEGTILLAIRECRLEPLVAVAPRVGAVLAIINDDERRHEVVLEHLTGAEPELLARIPMPLVGQRFELSLDRPGLLRARGEGTGEAPAYVYVPPHPYAAVTDEKGKVRFAEVAAGDYRVEAWHRPVTEDGAPLVMSAEVTVTAGKKSEVTISLSE